MITGEVKEVETIPLAADEVTFLQGLLWRCDGLGATS